MKIEMGESLLQSYLKHNEDSDLMANIRTTATFRKWKTRGIVKIELRID